MTPPDPAAYVGWYRSLSPPGAWTHFCSGATASDCWAQLLMADLTPRMLEKCVLPRGERPEGKKVKR